MIKIKDINIFKNDGLLVQISRIDFVNNTTVIKYNSSYGETFDYYPTNSNNVYVGFIDFNDLIYLIDKYHE